MQVGGSACMELREKAGRLGFEPRLMDPESTVLPLNYLPKLPNTIGQVSSLFKWLVDELFHDLNG